MEKTEDTRANQATQGCRHTKEIDFFDLDRIPNPCKSREITLKKTPFPESKLFAHRQAVNRSGDEHLFAYRTVLTGERGEETVLTFLVRETEDELPSRMGFEQVTIDYDRKRVYVQETSLSTKRKMFEQLLTALTYTQYQYFEQYFREEKSLVEIAQTEGKSPLTIKEEIRAGYERIKEEFFYEI